MVSRVTLSIYLLSVFNIGSTKENLNWTSVSESGLSTPPSLDNNSPSETNLSSSDIAQRLSQAHFEFTLKLYRALVQVGDPLDNMAFSPLLVSTLLTPTLLSAKDYAQALISASRRPLTPALPQIEGTASGAELVTSQESTIQKMLSMSEQIQQVLNFHDLSVGAVEAWHKATVASLQDKYYKRFLKAPRGFLLLQKGFLTKELDRVLRKWFGHTLRKFQEPLSSSRVLIELNKWSQNKTNNKIKDFLQETLLKSKTSIILSPASIESLWLNEFDPNNTFQKGLFYRTPDDRFEIPMMINRLELPLGYSQTLEARVLELPFQVRRASLFVILPDHMEQSLTNLESNVTSENVRSLLSTLKTEVVNLRIPKFYIDTTLSLVKALKMLGVKDLFNDGTQAGWHTEGTTADLRLDDFIHRIRFEVRESVDDTKSPSSFTSSKTFGAGIESKVEENIGKFGEKYFEVDHPFIFFLWDYIASTIICMGRVVDPRVVDPRAIDSRPVYSRNTNPSRTRIKKSIGLNKVVSPNVSSSSSSSSSSSITGVKSNDYSNNNNIL